ncbi:hypothetical protein E2C01_087462 [Portunus trituberculatus]|uniref:Uncharacterized protein n=1 Tax=Portunus trituberculatus TaxID=210409 RepID=A0A5B7JE38_PORTR|nr:hypothetical protein [Portunus trituberculatus]
MRHNLRISVVDSPIAIKASRREHFLPEEREGEALARRRQGSGITRSLGSRSHCFLVSYASGCKTSG